MLWKLQEITGVLGAAKKGLPMFGMAIAKVAMLEGGLMPSIVEKSIRYLEQHGECLICSIYQSLFLLLTVPSVLLLFS